MLTALALQICAGGIPRPTDISLAPGQWEVIGTDADTVTVIAAVGEDGLVGEAFVDAHDPTYQLALFTYPLDGHLTDPLDSQLLLATTRPEVLPVLRWSGDADGDSRPDLLVDLAQGAPTLFLSTQSQGTALVAAYPASCQG